MVIIRAILDPVRVSPSNFSPIIPFLFNFWKLNMKFGFMSGQQLCLFVKQHLAPYIWFGKSAAGEWMGVGLMCVGPAAGSIKSSAHSRGPLTPTSPLLISKWRPWLLLQHLLKGSPPALTSFFWYWEGWDRTMLFSMCYLWPWYEYIWWLGSIFQFMSYD